MINISVSCDPKFQSPNEFIVNKTTIHVMESNKIESGEISLIFGSDELLSYLKKEYFHKDQWTDVIAFRLNDYVEKVVEGEIYITLPRAEENSKSFGEPFEKEITRLIIHGCLHLLGFDDESKKEKLEMTQMENDFLSQINWQKIFES